MAANQAFTCDSCRKVSRGAQHRTTTRTLCDDCYLQFQGAVVGYLSGGTVADAVSTAGWAARVRKALRR